ncbi:MAG: hypothetical protein J5564_04145 [Clostridia bacterium]|nr:hypothetical protein [Clostridia bacterium]
MEENRTEQKQFKLFREKSLEAVESPDSLNDYLRVTSPGVWLVLAAAVLLLAGGIVWGIFGRIETRGTYAVTARDGETVLCYVPIGEAEKVAVRGRISVEGREYLLKAEDSPAVVTVSDQTDPYIVSAGNLQAGQVMVLIPVLAELPAGIYTGTVILESLQPVSLLLG